MLGEGNDAVVIAIVGVLAFLAVAMVMSRNTSRQKKAAIASLKEEKDLVGHYDIMAMANEEIESLGLRSISGADGLSTDVLLKTWKNAPQDIRDCDREALSYVVANGIDPEQASAAQVRLVCSDAPGAGPDDSPDVEE